MDKSLKRGTGRSPSLDVVMTHKTLAGRICKVSGARKLCIFHRHHGTQLKKRIRKRERGGPDPARKRRTRKR